MKSSWTIGIVLLAGYAQGQAIFADALQKQIACEKKLIREADAKEILSGPEYKIFLEVAAAFGRDDPPRLYFFPEAANSAYVAGSVAADGKGMILMSQTSLRLMGAPALRGIMAHEMAHLAVDVHGDTSCDSRILRDPNMEIAADALAADKVGFGPVRAFLLQIEVLTGARNADAVSRLQALEKLEAKSRQR